MKRLLSTIIALSMIVCLLPVHSFAQSDITAECNISDGAENVSNPNLTETVTVTFNQTMDASTLNASYVQLYGADYVGQYTVADDKKSISFDMKYLRPETTYKLIVKGGLKNADGVSIGEDMILATFTTGSIYVSDEDTVLKNVSLSKNISTPDGFASDSHKIEWLVDGTYGNMPQLTKDLNEDGRRSFTIDLEEAYTVKAIDLSLHNGYQGYNNWMIYGHDTKDATSDEMTLLADTTGVNVNYKAGAATYRIFLDNNVSYRYITCSRGGSVYTYECTVWAGVPADVIVPIMAECNIEDGATDVENPNLTEKVTVTFNQSMDSSTLNTNYVLLTEKDWNRIAQYEVNDDLTEISFGMEYLNPNKIYTLKVKRGIKNADGTELDEDIELATFTTGDIIVSETADGETLQNVSFGKTVIAEGSGNTAYITNGSQGERFDGVDEDREGAAHFTIDLEEAYKLKAADMALHGGYGGFNLWKVYGHNDPDADISAMTEIGMSPQNAWIAHASEGATYRIFFDNDEEYRYITFVRASNSFWIYECTVWANAAEDNNGDDNGGNGDTPGGDNGGQTPPPVEIPDFIDAQCNIEDGATDVENPNLTEKVTVTFNQPMDSSTLNTNYVLLTEKDWNRIAQYEVNDDLTEISFGMEYLSPNKVYTLKIKRGIKSADGKEISEDIELCAFTTGNIIAGETADGEELKKVSVGKTVIAEGTGNTAYITNGSQGERFDGVDEDREGAAHFTIDLEEPYKLKAADMALHGGYGGFNLWKVYGHNDPDADISAMTEIGMSPQDAWIAHASEGATYRIFFDNDEEYRYITFVRASNSFWIYECTVWANAEKTAVNPDNPGSGDTPVSSKIVRTLDDATKIYSANGVDKVINSASDGRRFTTFSSSEYAEWEVQIPESGVYLISFFAGFKNSSNTANMATYVDVGDGLGYIKKGELPLVQGESMSDFRENPVCVMNLEPGTIKVKILQTQYPMYMSDLVISRYDDFTLVNVKTGGSMVDNGAELERSTDYFELTFNRNVNSESINNIKLINDNEAVMTEAESNGNKVTLYLRESLDYGKTYTLTANGVKDIYNVYEISDKTVSYVTTSQDGEAAFVSAGVTATNSKIDYNKVSLEGIVLSSKAKAISGRKADIYVKYPNGTVSQNPVVTVMSDKDGRFIADYTIADGSESGKYTFIIKAEYSQAASEEIVIYVSTVKEQEIINDFKDTDTKEDVITTINNHKIMLNINPETDLVNIPDTDRFYTHFIGDEYRDFNEFLDKYKEMIAFETVNQAQSADTVKIILDDEFYCAKLGADKRMVDCLINNRDTFLGDVAGLEPFDKKEDYIAEFNRILNKHLSNEFGKSEPVMSIADKTVYTGEGISIELSFADYVTDVKEITYEISTSNATEFFKNAYITLDIKGTHEVNKNGNVLTVKIIPEAILTRVNNIGTLYLSSVNTIGNYIFSIEGEVIHSVRKDYGNGKERYESVNLIQPKNITVNVIQASNSSSGMTSSSSPALGRPGGSSSGGSSSGGGISTPVVTPPTQETEYAFDDLPKGHWAEESVNGLVNMGVISKAENKIFNPDKEISREEFIKMVVIAFGMWDKDIKGDTFADVTIDNWYYSYVYSAEKHGIVTGNGNGFGAGQKITREDMSVILSRVLSMKGITAEYDGEAFADNADISDYAHSAVYSMKKLGVINGMGDNLFAPKNTATRAMAAKVIWELSKLTTQNN